MKHKSKLFSLLALLILGSARLAAQATDPFPAVDVTKYANSMIITGQVRMNGKVLTKDDNVVVAVFQGDELRGKDVLFDTGSYNDLFMVMVYGDTNGELLSFKVYAEGSIFEADQQLTYTINGHTGKPSDPYYIDLHVEGVVTSITKTTDQPTNTETYNLKGCRTQPYAKGIVIRNNRKYLNK
jgi:hypothetical protein